MVVVVNSAKSAMTCRPRISKSTEKNAAKMWPTSITVKNTAVTKKVVVGTAAMGRAVQPAKATTRTRAGAMTIDDDEDEDEDTDATAGHGHPTAHKRVRLTSSQGSAHQPHVPAKAPPLPSVTSSSEDEELDEVDHEALRAMTASINASAASSPPAHVDPVALTDPVDAHASAVLTRVSDAATSSSGDRLGRSGAATVRGGRGHGPAARAADDDGAPVLARRGVAAAAAHVRTAMAGIVASITAVRRHARCATAVAARMLA